jgi:hypothetical protein
MRENAYEQSVDAYQICTEENIHNLSKCAPLIKLMDEDKKRLERLSKAIKCIYAA